jgi:hypothetical protein
MPTEVWKYGIKNSIGILYQRNTVDTLIFNEYCSLEIAVFFGIAEYRENSASGIAD